MRASNFTPAVVLAAIALGAGFELAPIATPRAVRGPVPHARVKPASSAPIDECGTGTLLRRARESSLVGLGSPAPSSGGVAGAVDVDTFLGGRDGVPASRPARAVRVSLPQRAPSGSRVLVLLQSKNGTLGVSDALALDPTRHAGLEQLVSASLARDPSTAAGRTAWGRALAQGVLSGADLTRDVAAEELQGEATVVLGSLDADTVEALATTAASLDGADPALANLLEVFGATGDPARAADVVGVVARPHAEAVLDQLPRLLRHLGPEGAALLLSDHTLTGTPARERRRAAHVLARLGTESAHGALTRLLADADQDVASEAILGLASLKDPAAVERARRIVRAHLLPERRTASPREIDQIVARRNTDVLRLTVLPSGDAYKLMVAGFVLLRTTEGSDRAWLTARLGRVDDAIVARFLERRASEPWAAFDAAW